MPQQFSAQEAVTQLLLPVLRSIAPKYYEALLQLQSYLIRPLRKPEPELSILGILTWVLEMLIRNTVLKLIVHTNSEMCS